MDSQKPRYNFFVKRMVQRGITLILYLNMTEPGNRYYSCSHKITLFFEMSKDNSCLN